MLLSMVFLLGCQQDKVLVRTNDDKLVLVESRLAMLDAKDDLLQAQIDALNTRVEDVEAFKTFQIMQNSFVSSEVTRLEGLITQVQDNASSALISEVNSLTGMINGLSTRVNTQFAAMQSQIDNIQLTPGKSAYEVWLELGNVGTQQDFIEALRGLQGPQGIQGNTGLTGPQGAQGEPGDSVKMIKLCPSDSAAYPEQGIVLGTSIYAVYYGVIGDTPQAFMAKLSPGDYVTTNGSNCHFKVKPNGTTGGN